MTRPFTGTARKTMLFSEIVSIAIDSFRSSKVLFALTATGMVIGTASLIVVVTIGLTGRQYVMSQIEAIGANLIYVEYEVSRANDFLTVEDLRAVQQQVPGIRAASPTRENNYRISVGGGKERDILVIGVDPAYATVRNLEIVAGSMFDSGDSIARHKVADVSQKYAKKTYGNERAAVGKIIKVNGLPFVIIGVFRERVETFGQSEIQDDTVLIPFTTGRLFTDNDAAKQLFFSVSDAGEVPRTTALIQKIVQSRHRPGSVYHAQNLTQLLSVAENAAFALTLVLLGVSLVTLIVSGVGIMNIMLANVRTRIKEIGIRKAIGATNREIKLQFLTESVLISLSGGVAGTILGLAIPFSVRFLTDLRVPISGLSAVIAIFVASLVGVIFGTVPATRASQLDPVEALHNE